MQDRAFNCRVFNVELESGEQVPHIQYGVLRRGDVILYRRFDMNNKIYYTKERIKRIVSIGSV
jgi:hypothetical protein